MARVETIVFLSLVLDLFAFTIPLPLFPRLIEWYTLVSDLQRQSIHPLTHSLLQRESSDPTGFLPRTLQFITAIRTLFYKSGIQSRRWDVVLLGGLMGSIFSCVNCLATCSVGGN